MLSLGCGAHFFRNHAVDRLPLRFLRRQGRGGQVARFITVCASELSLSRCEFATFTLRICHLHAANLSPSRCEFVTSTLRHGDMAVRSVGGRNHTFKRNPRLILLVFSKVRNWRFRRRGVAGCRISVPALGEGQYFCCFWPSAAL